MDPVDSTYRYIKGSAGIKPIQGISPRGLQCITVLIGVYDIQTGVPLMGVINQPFASQDLNSLRQKAQCYWGLSYMGTNTHPLLPPIYTVNKSERQSQVTQNPSSEQLPPVLSSHCLLSHFSHVWLSATPWTTACQAPLSVGFSRQEYWSGLPFPSPVIQYEVSEVKSLSCVRLCDPVDCSLLGSSVRGIFQARVLEWVAISFSIALISTSEQETMEGEHCHVCVQSASSGQLGLVPRACVFLGLVDIYIFSKDTTFRWYSCAAHAILRALDWGMVDLKECLGRNPDMGLDLPRLVYQMGNEGTAGVDQWPTMEDSSHTDQSSSWRHSWASCSSIWPLQIHIHRCVLSSWAPQPNCEHCFCISVFVLLMVNIHLPLWGSIFPFCVHNVNVTKWMIFVQPKKKKKDLKPLSYWTS